jgi:hypothetical protein
MSLGDALTDLGKTIIKIGAPLLGTAIAGPAGAAIGQMVAAEFGGSLADPNGLIQKVITDPNAAVKLIEIQNNTKVQLQQITMQVAENELKYATQQQEIDYQNTKSAREANAQAKSFMPEILSTVITVGFFGCIYWVAVYPQDKSDAQVLYMLLGAMASAFGAVINYWLGSSAGSRLKDIAMYKKG